MSPSCDEKFGAALGALLDLAGVPRSGLMLAARQLPPADHLAEIDRVQGPARQGRSLGTSG